MRRLLLPVSLAFVVSLFLAPFAVAQEEEMEPPQEEATESVQEEVQEELMEPQPEPPFAEEQKMMQQQPKMKEKGKEKEMPKSGGLGVESFALAGIGALLLASGVLAYTVAVRRR
jgi:hypothetical protein